MNQINDTRQTVRKDGAVVGVCWPASTPAQQLHPSVLFVLGRLFDSLLGLFVLSYFGFGFNFDFVLSLIIKVRM